MMRGIHNYFLMLLCVGCFVQSCIPIEDKIAPQVNPFDIRPIYFYQDTINFSVIFTDNSGLDSGSLVIEKMAGLATPGPEAWFFLDTFDIRGRRIAPDFSIQIPEYKETGDYLITVFGFDEGRNPDTVKRVFTLEADAKPPVFNNLDVSLEQISDSLYKACRSEVIRFDGYVTDNLKISQVGFSYGNERENNGFYSTDSITFREVFQDFIRIPPDTPDSTLLSLQIVAVDTFQNRQVQQFNILVACDDQSPSFEIANATPQISIENRVKVTQGGQLAINEMYISENDSLRSVDIYYNKSSEPLRLKRSIDLSGTAGKVKLNDFVNLNFTVPIDDVLGTIREITFVATDVSGNQSELYKVFIDVILDEPPLILLTNTYINDIATDFSAIEYVAVQRGDIISFAGKVEELNQLDLLEMYWYEEGLLPAIQVSENTFNSPTINLVDFYNADTFTIPSTVSLGANYVLLIRAVDAKGQETTRKFLFTVR